MENEEEADQDLDREDEDFGTGGVGKPLDTPSRVRFLDTRLNKSLTDEEREAMMGALE